MRIIEDLECVLASLPAARKFLLEVDSACSTVMVVVVVVVGDCGVGRCVPH